MGITAQTHNLVSGIAAGLFTAGPQETWAHAHHEGWSPDPPGVYCHRCGVSAGPGATTDAGCSFCRGNSVPWDRIVRLSTYREPIRPWLTVMKFQRQWAWCQLLGRELADRLPPEAPPAEGPEAPACPDASGEATPKPQQVGPRTIVCPVPMHWLRRWRRGYNQAQLIADALAQRRGWPRTDLLRRVRRTAPQTTVPTSRRADNIRGSFAARPVNLAGWDVWLVDDIKTTGATLAVCAKLLRGAGARSVNVAVAAVADPFELRTVQR